MEPLKNRVLEHIVATFKSEDVIAESRQLTQDLPDTLVGISDYKSMLLCRLIYDENLEWEVLEATKLKQLK